MPAAEARSLLIEHLKSKRRLGEKTVYLTPEAQAALAEVKAAPAPVEVKPEPIAQAIEEPKIIAPVEFDIPAGDKVAALAAIKTAAKSSGICAQLGTLRPTFVFATGTPDAPVVFVGEAPGHEEELKREPFVGPPGRLFDKIVKATGLSREKIYISNVVKWRPMMGDGTTQGISNRKPTTAEMSAAKQFVLKEIEVIQPKVVVALGASAAEGLLGLTDPLAKLRGNTYDIGGIPAIVTYHPSYLLRNEALTERRKVWEDMMVMMEKIGLPISEKQRGFFLK